MSLLNFWRIEYPTLENDSLINYLLTKNCRSNSGVLVVTVLTSPFPEFTLNGKRVKQAFSCKQNCAQCPDEPEVQIKMYIQSVKVDIELQFIEFKIKCQDDMKLISALTYTLFKDGTMATVNKFIEYLKMEKGTDQEQMSFSFRVGLNHLNNQEGLMALMSKQIYNDYVQELSDDIDIDIDKDIPIEGGDGCMLGLTIVESENVHSVDLTMSPFKWYLMGVKIAQPRSQLSTEPGVMRANHNNFDPVLQFFSRVYSLETMGHVVDKIEILILGGTWSHQPVEQQEQFIRDLYQSANIYFDQREPKSLTEEMDINESNKTRIIGITTETRPDCINEAEILRYRKYGVTRVQLGLQSIFDDVLTKIERGCQNEDAINAICLLKSNCFKIDIHLMPDLPGSSIEKDNLMFNTILGHTIVSNTTTYNTSFDIKINQMKYNLEYPFIQTDQWKIYPCSTLDWTKIKEWYQDGSQKPYSDEIENLIDVLINCKSQVFPWIRLNRVIRDIPNQNILGGNTNVNLRQLIMDRMKKQNIKCKCMRCREVKDRDIGEFPEGQIVLRVREYNAYEGTEYFISIETLDASVLFGFVRLRINDNDTQTQFDILKHAGLIRELHVQGKLVHHESTTSKVQHKGQGKMLVKMAEVISKQHGMKRVAIISGIGVREQQKKRGYSVIDSYLVKELDQSWSDSVSRVKGVKWVIVLVMMILVSQIIMVSEWGQGQFG